MKLLQKFLTGMSSFEIKFNCLDPALYVSVGVFRLTEGLVVLN